MDPKERPKNSLRLGKGVRKMKIGLYMCAFREPHLIQPSIRQWLPFKLHRFIVAASERPWFGDLEKDNTADLARETGVEVIEKHWKTEADQRNEIMDILEKDGCEYVIHWFPDQFLIRADRVKVFEFLFTKPTDSKVYSLDGYTYWKDFIHAIEPQPKIKAITTPDLRFDFSYHIQDHDSGPTLDVTLYHLQWAKTKKDIKNKLESYGHAPEIEPTWYKRYFEDKVEDPHDFHPISAGAFSNTFEHELPKEIKSLLDPEWVKEVANG